MQTKHQPKNERDIAILKEIEAIPGVKEVRMSVQDSILLDVDADSMNAVIAALRKMHADGKVALEFEPFKL